MTAGSVDTGVAEANCCCFDERTAETARLIGMDGMQAVADATSSSWCSVLDWAHCGAMVLTGRADGPPLAPRAPVATRIRAALDAMTVATGQLGVPVRLDLGRLLAWRAQRNGWSRRGTLSAGGSCHLVKSADGWLGVNLARPEDDELIRLLLGPRWRQQIGRRTANDTVVLLGELGVPIAELGSVRAGLPVMAAIGESAGHREPRAVKALRVVDLSSMWAGPLCSMVLARAGMRVVKVEDVRRPDGARAGSREFYDWLHAGQATVAVDFASPAPLARMIDEADVVIESSRPRALRNVGIAAEEWLAAAAGRTWVSITGYGRRAENRVAFGDDAAVAGGLVATDAAGPVFCADAIADPLTGVHAAIAALRSVRSGGGHLIDVSMAAVCADVARPGSGPTATHTVRRIGSSWQVAHGCRSVTC